MINKLINIYVAEKRLQENGKFITEARTYLLNPGPDIVVADEAHIIKEKSSLISETMNLIRTKRRIALTGIFIYIIVQ